MAHWHRNDGGWWFREGVDELRPDVLQEHESFTPDGGFEPARSELGLSLWKVYASGDSSYSGRATVPLLFDRTLGSLGKL